MATFLSESYLKPKLIESRLINKMIKEQNNKITFEKKAITYIKNFILQHWKIIIGLLLISSLLYWRYKEIKNIRNNKTIFTKSNNKYEEDSEYDTTE